MMTREWVMEEEAGGIWAFVKREEVEIGKARGEQLLGMEEKEDG